MITQSEVKIFKMISEMQINEITGGAIYFAAEGDTITWSISSNDFRIDALQVGQKLNIESCTLQAMNIKKTVTVKLPRSVYGTRIVATSMPVANESGEITGAVTIVFPRLHPIATAFDKFAPLLSKMFPEGVFLYVSDLHKIINRQSSEKFDMHNIVIGYELKETDIALKTIKTKKHSIEEIDSNPYGVPVLIVNYPLFDEDNADEIVGSFGLVIPKGAAFQLRELSNNIGNGLDGISSAIEQLSISASQIHSNESKLNTSLQEVYKLSEEINAISVLIKQIAEQTNMLGLNAAIEAARAGDLGRGFSVVANEIRKLSNQTKNSVPKIKELTDNIKDKIDNVTKISEITLGASQEQSAATQETTSSIEEISGLAEDLNNLSLEL